MVIKTTPQILKHTIALNVGGYFMDLRVVTADQSLEWSRAGERKTLGGNPTRYKWTRNIDSFASTQADEAAFTTLPNGDDLESGTFNKDDTATEYEEVWRDVTKETDKPSWIAQSSDGTTFVGRVGDSFLGMRQSKQAQGRSAFAVRREAYDETAQSWKLVFECGDGLNGAIPCAADVTEVMDAVDGHEKSDAKLEAGIGSQVTVRGTDYIIRGYHRHSNSVQCQAINRSGKTSLPRSAVQYLEDLIAQLGHGSHPASTLTTHQQVDTDRAEAYAVYRAVLQAAAVAVTSTQTALVLRNSPGIHYHARLFYSSERPPLKIPVRGVYVEEPPRTAGRAAVPRPLHVGARGIPFTVAAKLFDNYIKNVLPRHPCFLASDLSHQFNLFYQETGEPVLTDETIFVVSMVLAVSALTSRTREFSKVAALSESLQRSALRHATFLSRNSFRSLQCFTLLIQMALWLPYSANQWYMSGEAMRMAIALGLHEEAQDNPNIDAVGLSLRRNTFWTIYNLEKTIAIASGCPLSISDEHITTLIPSNDDILAMNSASYDSEKASQFIKHVEISQIQSEIHGVQFFDQALPADTPEYTDWMRRIEHSIQAWQDSLAPDGNIPAWSIAAADHCHLLLYRPCSRNMVPDELCLQAACTVAIRIVNRHWAAIQNGSPIFAFQYVYAVFQAGMILLYVLGNHGAAEVGSALEAEAHQALTLLESLFEKLSIGWPACADTGIYMNELKDTVFRKITVGEVSRRSSFDTDLLAELDFMVTQRRIHSVYHRNVQTWRPLPDTHSELAPWSHPDSFTPLSDELWQDLMNTTFEFPADDTLLLQEPFNAEPVYQWNDTVQEETASLTVEAAQKNEINVEMLMRSVPACGYCRTRHVKCGQEFPSCGTCSRTGRECVYYDAVLQRDIPRR
ncbi:hypothetical protein N0V90_008645 [Kalmusia sp. IMI 367209]|nr:hypothetical protein N0V90_008645 [Kalmusia sp. IMI 367209]